MIVNVTGWNELINGSLFAASTAVFEYAIGDWYITLLFLAFKVMLYLGTRSIVLSVILTAIFLSVFGAEVNATVLQTVVAIFVFELAAVLYSIFHKK
jgi:hypothetical protein